MTDEESGRWPTAGHELVDELGAARGRLALVEARSLAEADVLVDRFRTDVALHTVRLGLALADRPQPPTPAEIDAACVGTSVLTDLDFLFWPGIDLAPLGFLTTRARRQPTIAVWPGRIAGVRAGYSFPGRPDHFDAVLRDAVVLRPRATRFPDEVPFTIERIPA